jgi:hypothetical protein
MQLEDMIIVLHHATMARAVARKNLLLHAIQCRLVRVKQGLRGALATDPGGSFLEGERVCQRERSPAFAG